MLGDKFHPGGNVIANPLIDASWCKAFSIRVIL
jgi:hypothetical protein